MNYKAINILKVLLSIIVIVLGYCLVVLFCSIMMTKVPRWVAWIVLPLYGGAGVLLAWASEKISPNEQIHRRILAGLALLSCALNIFFGLGYRDLCVCIFAAALMGAP